MLNIVKAVHEKSKERGLSIHDEEIKDDSIDGM
jgi:hypothetical protein